MRQLVGSRTRCGGAQDPSEDRVLGVVWPARELVLETSRSVICGPNRRRAWEGRGPQLAREREARAKTPDPRR